MSRLQSSWIIRGSPQLKLLLLLLPLLLLELEVNSMDIKWHSAGAAFGSPAAWLDDYMPCVHDLVVFPEYYPAVLPLPADLAVQGFVLPRQGALLLAEDASISLGAGRGLNGECENDEHRAVLRPPKTSKWFDPSSWRDQPSVGLEASGSSSILPELERVPCDDEHVVIPSQSAAFSFDLEHVQYLRLGQLILAGSSISRMYLQELMGRELGQLLFHNSQGVNVEYYHGELCGCHKDYEHLIEPVCHNVESQCPEPHCVSPIRPLGSCCFVCGAMITFRMENCINEDRAELYKFMRKALISADLLDELQLHVGFVGSKQYGNVIQAVVQDRGSYSERSIEFMRTIIAQRNESSLLSNANSLELKLAGHPYNPNVTFASVLLILFCLVFVAIVSIIMLAHFMPENPYLNRIPQWIHDPRRWRWHHLGMRLRQNLLFNRFDDASGQGTASAADHLAVIGYDAESGEVRERSFNNPMFEQQETEEHNTADVFPSLSLSPSASTAPGKSDVSTVVLSPHVETGELDSCSGEEQELTEIHLESSDADSDVEAETKE